MVKKDNVPSLVGGVLGLIITSSLLIVCCCVIFVDVKSIPNVWNDNCCDCDIYYGSVPDWPVIDFPLVQFDCCSCGNRTAQDFVLEFYNQSITGCRHDVYYWCAEYEKQIGVPSNCFYGGK